MRSFRRIARFWTNASARPEFRLEKVQRVSVYSEPEARTRDIDGLRIADLPGLASALVGAAIVRSASNLPAGPIRPSSLQNVAYVQVD
jgi:hypothetical protein